MVNIKLSDYKKGLSSSPKLRQYYPKKVLVQGTYEDIIKYYNNTPVALKGIYKHSLNYLIRKSYDELYNSGGDFLKSPIDYVGLMAFVLPFFGKDINEFVRLRDSFESAYIKGDYQSATTLLDRANEISYSLWAATNKIRVAELIGGIDKRLDEYNKILSQASHPMTSYVCNYAQETASIETSLQTFIEQRQAEVLKMPFNEKWQFDYILALLFPYKYVEPSVWISYCMKSSIIDVYCNLIDHLCLIIKSCQNDDRLLDYLKKIASAINDSRLQKYIYLLEANWTKTDHERLQARDSNDVTVLSKFSDEHPVDIDVLFRHVSLCAINGIEVGNSNGCLKDRMEYHLYNVLSGNNVSLHTTKLKMICLSNQSIFAFRHLFNIISEINTCNIAKYGNSYWYFSTGINPLDAKFYQTASVRCEFLKTIGGNPDVSITKDSVLPLDTFECLSIVEGKLDKYRLDLEYMASERKLPIYTEPLIISYLFQRYFEEKEYLSCVFLYVDYHLANPGAHIDVNTKAIEASMTRTIDSSLKCPLELAIFYHLIKAKPAKIAANVKRYLTLLGIDKPSEICEMKDPKVRYFLENVVDVDVIDLIPLLFEDTNDSIAERIKVLKQLLSSGSNKKLSNEIKELMSDYVINNNLRHVDASKIDVDVSLLKKGNLNGAREIFELYTNTSEKVPYAFNEEVIAQMFPVEELNWEEAKSATSKLYNMPYKQYLFIQFYLMIRDAFLLDDIAGLESYLSSRIRHGTVVNQLRTDLQDNRLTTRKNEAGGYDVNTYWAIDVFNLDGEEFTRVTEAFLEFTTLVDSQIAHLKNEKIQVKTELFHTEKSACFDFSQKKLQKRIYNLYKMNITSFDSALDIIIEDLWDYTESCFVDMRNQVSTCAEQIDNGILKLRVCVNQYVGKDNKGLVQFRDCITTCRTLLENDSKIVQDWFQRNKSKASDFTMEVLNETAIEGLKRITDVELSVSNSITSASSLKGRFLGTMYVLLNNIYGNVVDYYSSFSKVATCETSITEDGDCLSIQILNRVSESDVNRIQRDIDQYNIDRTKTLLAHKARTDQKSGFYKMHNIVYGYFNHRDNSFKVELDNLNFKVSIVLNIKDIRS